MRYQALGFAAATVLLVGLGSAPADAATRTFTNCRAMNVVYKGGVAQPGATDKRSGGGHARYAPKVDRSLYQANAKSDRDHDGIACEK